jgi:hypothetical protein
LFVGITVKKLQGMKLVCNITISAELPDTPWVRQCHKPAHSYVANVIKETQCHHALMAAAHTLPYM